MKKTFTFILTILVLAGMTAQAAAPTLNYEINGNNLVITYTGTLLQSADAVNWTEVQFASSPYKVALGNKKQFFCAKGESGGENITIPLSDKVNLDLIWVEPGTFTMGSPEDELGRWGDEEQHEVTLTEGYWLGKYEVTQAQYEAIMGNNPSDQPDGWGNYYRGVGENYPVYHVSWYDAVNFCAKLTVLEKAAGRLPEGYEYTLPTEAQWEYACRAGTTTAFNNGTNIPTEEQAAFFSPEPCPNLDPIAWYAYNSGDYDSNGTWTDNGKTFPVGQKQPNAWGLYDMHGNVHEWCLDWYGDYPTSSATDPKGTGEDSYCVIRGGGWGSYACNCRSASRIKADPYNSNGFRVALSKSKNITVPLPDDMDLDMIWIEPGTFTMGSPTDELGRSSDETQHQVTLAKGYWLGKYEVTQSQYEAVMGSNPSGFKGADRPVEKVSWDNAMRFCAKLNAQEKAAGRLPEGYEYTLPTEAQWEYACRADTTTALNNGKNLTNYRECSEIDEVGWYYYNSDSKTHSVGQKQPNVWGLYDMHGNVFEWCLDWYGDYPSTAVANPTGPTSGSFRVRRGGCWCVEACDNRSASRFRYSPDIQTDYIGFRVALAPIDLNITIPLSDGVDLDMVWIKPGTFTMGSPESELGRSSDEVLHQVTLTQGYWLGKYEVTQAQYQAIMETNPSYYKGADLPVEQVSWNDAMDFCAKLTEIEKTAGRLPAGYEYTLPTEAQWEYACRAGTSTALNSGMDLSNAEECPEMDEVGWYYYNSDSMTHPVGQKQPNAWGLYDMHGNVYEWCLDWYGDYPTSSVIDPTGSDTGDLRVQRGGGRSLRASGCRSAWRSSSISTSRYRIGGFRVALTPVK